MPAAVPAREKPLRVTGLAVPAVESANVAVPATKLTSSVPMTPVSVPGASVAVVVPS